MEDLVKYFGLKLERMMPSVVEFGFRKDLSIEARLVLIFMFYLGVRKGLVSFRRRDFSVLNVSEKLVRRALQELVAANLVDSANKVTHKQTSGRPIDMFILTGVPLGTSVNFSPVGENEKLVECLLEKGVARSASGIDVKIKVAIDYLILILIYAHPSPSGEVVFNDFARSLGVKSARLARRVNNLVDTELISCENLNGDYLLRQFEQSRKYVDISCLSLTPFLEDFKTLTRYIDLIGQDKWLLGVYSALEDVTLRCLINRHFPTIVDPSAIRNLFLSCRRVGFRVSYEVRSRFIREVSALRAEIGTAEAKFWREELAKARERCAEAKAQALEDLRLVDMILADLLVGFLSELGFGFEGESTVRFSSMLYDQRYPKIFIRRLESDSKNVDSAGDEMVEHKK